MCIVADAPENRAIDVFTLTESHVMFDLVCVTEVSRRGRMLSLITIVVRMQLSPLLHTLASALVVGVSCSSGGLSILWCCASDSPLIPIHVITTVHSLLFCPSSPLPSQLTNILSSSTPRISGIQLDPLVYTPWLNT